ncbi:MAG: alanine racemase [Candidatus Eremiobacteraeota bacterium]|nr:alanine racemase [Candidatus Eremiobacteraeota bacterium]
MPSSSPTAARSSAALAHIEVDVPALRRNAAQLRTIAAPARFAAVVKANAYGHGLAGVAEALEREVDLFCVYRAQEGHEIRARGIETPVLVLGPVTPSELAGALEAHLAITLWDTQGYRDDVIRTARESGRPFPVHVKIDTGVTRFGLPAERATAALREDLREPALGLEGVFTHLAAVEELESAFTTQQLERFETALRPLESELRRRGVRKHAAASAATMLFPELRLDLVRVGIATYGVWPSPETQDALRQPINLEPALSWRTELIVIQEVPAGTPVGYGCTFSTARPSRIGVLPIGYAEGIPRAASNRGAVLVHGRRAPIVGRVCMNVTMVDVTDIPQAHPGSTTTLIGLDGEERLRAEDWAAWCGTIGYEIVARLPAEIPRVYRAE